MADDGGNVIPFRRPRPGGRWSPMMRNILALIEHHADNNDTSTVIMAALTLVATIEDAPDRAKAIREADFILGCDALLRLVDMEEEEMSA
jgi:hypothetical protein